MAISLTKDQKKYLRKIPVNKIVRIYPFDQKILKVSKKIIQAVKAIYPDLEIRHLGASALGISGQNDLDIYAFANPSDFGKFLPGLIRLFGKPLHEHETFIEWNFTKNGFAVQFYLTDPNSSSMKDQRKVFEILKKNGKLLSRYEILKKTMNGKSFREYQKKKYEFFNKVLKIK